MKFHIVITISPSPSGTALYPTLLWALVWTCLFMALVVLDVREDAVGSPPLLPKKREEKLVQEKEEGYYQMGPVVRVKNLPFKRGSKMKATKG